MAEKLYTSRQAVSKWENNNGYPETEKIILIGKIFLVKLDVLLLGDRAIGSDHEIKLQEEFFLSFLAVFQGYLRNDSFWTEWRAFYGGNDVSYIYGSFHSGNFDDRGMVDQLYDTFYFRKKKPGICDLLIIGHEEKADCRPLQKRKSLSWNRRSFCRIAFGRRAAADPVLSY